MEISAVIITFNEEENLPSLKENLAGIDDVVVLDGGSTDKTRELAREYGWRVYERKNLPLERFTATEADREKFKQRWGYEANFKPGFVMESAASSRSYGAQLAKNDWVYFPDADERITWDIEKIKTILDQVDILYYTFVQAVGPDGKSIFEITHSKFFNKNKAKWVFPLHESIVAGEGARHIKMDREHLIVKHYPKIKTSRNDYLGRIEFAVLQDEKNTKMIQYLGREHFLYGNKELAIKFFNVYLESLDTWDDERSQVMIYMAACTGDIDWLLKATKYKRREPFYELGKHYFKQKDYQRAVLWFIAALEVPFNNEYMADVGIYTWKINDLLSVCYNKLGRHKEAQEQWEIASKNAPEDQLARIAQNKQYIFN